MSTNSDVDTSNTSAEWESFLIGEDTSPNLNNKSKVKSNDTSINNIISPKSMINNIKSKDSKKIFDSQFGNDDDVDVDLLNNTNEGISSDYNTILDDDFQYLNDMSPTKSSTTSTTTTNNNNKSISISMNETLDQKIARVMNGISKSNKVSTSHNNIYNNVEVTNKTIVDSIPLVNPLMTQLGIDDALSPINSPLSDLTSLSSTYNSLNSTINNTSNNDKSKINLDHVIESEVYNNIPSPIVSPSVSISPNGSNNSKSTPLNVNNSSIRNTNIPTRISKERDTSNLRSVIIKMDKMVSGSPLHNNLVSNIGDFNPQPRRLPPTLLTSSIELSNQLSNENDTPLFISVNNSNDINSNVKKNQSQLDIVLNNSINNSSNTTPIGLPSMISTTSPEIPIPWSLSKRASILDSNRNTPYDAHKNGYNGDINNTILTNTNDQVLKVSVRVRPFSTNEINSAARRIVSFNDDKLVIVNPSAFDADPDTIAAAAAVLHCKEWAQVFKFNNCLWSYDAEDEQDVYVSQEGVYRSIGCEIVDNVLNGITSSCFAYGHTGTGKTYSMFGSISENRKMDIYNEASNDRSYIITEKSGLIPRVFSGIIEGIKQRDFTCKDTKITISFLEIYNEKIRDLLVDDLDNIYQYSKDKERDRDINVTSLKIREHPIHGTYVEGLTKVTVSTTEEALKYLQYGLIKRKISSNNWNFQSSRSHTVVTLELSPIEFNNDVINKNSIFSPPSSNGSAPKSRNSLHSSNVKLANGNKLTQEQTYVRVSMVDLAGSEQDVRQFINNHHDDYIKGMATTINSSKEKTDLTIEKNENKIIRRSLSTLGYIIKALGRGAAQKSLPYRDSILTWLLKDSLCGSNFTTILATMSPSHTVYEESLSTLKYAERLCLVGTRPSHIYNVNSSISNEFNQLGLELSNSTSSSPLTSPTRNSSSIPNEFTRIQQGLGVVNPGTLASRQLLKQMLNDPQQRIAKADRSLHNNTNVGNNLTSKLLGESGAISQEDSSSVYHSNNAALVDHLKDVNRELQSLLVDLQIENNSLKTDRDMQLVQLAGMKESIATNSELNSKHQKLLSTDINNTNKLMEKENIELREIILRQEANTDRLLNIIGEEQNESFQLKSIITSQKTDFLLKISKLEDNIVNITKELEPLLGLDILLQKEKHEKEALIKEIEVEKNKNIMIQSCEINLKNTINDLSNEIKVITELNRVNGLDLDNNKIKLISVEKENRELTRQISSISTERNALIAMIDQQDAAIKLQYNHFELSLEMLHQRQADLDKIEIDAGKNFDELLHLQKNLESLLVNESDTLQNELIDAKRLTGMISTARERMQATSILQDELDRELSSRLQLQTQHEILKTEIALARRDLPKQTLKTTLLEQDNYAAATKSKELIVLQYKLEISEKNIQYWKNITKRVVNNDDKFHDFVAKNNEMNTLDASKSYSKNDGSIKQQSKEETMQIELSSLWVAVQELNKLDLIKEKAMKDLLEERNRALLDKDKFYTKLIDMTNKHNLLKEELEEIDRDLINAMNNNSNINTISNNRSMKTNPKSSISNLHDQEQHQYHHHQYHQQHQNPINKKEYNLSNQQNYKYNNNNTNVHNNKDLINKPLSNRRNYDNNSEDSIDYTETILEQQVQQLTNFLQEDKLKLNVQHNRSNQRILNENNTITPRKR